MFDIYELYDLLDFVDAILYNEECLEDKERFMLMHNIIFNLIQQKHEKDEDDDVKCVDYDVLDDSLDDFRFQF